MYLSDRGALVNTRRNRKQQLIEQVIIAHKLERPTMPSQTVRNVKSTATGTNFYSVMVYWCPFLRQFAPADLKEVNIVVSKG